MTIVNIISGTSIFIMACYLLVHFISLLFGEGILTFEEEARTMLIIIIYGLSLLIFKENNNEL